MLLDLLIQKAHKEIFDHIISLYASSKLPHALLFTGPQGVGKFDVAKALAEKILPPTSTRADLHILEPETQMKSYSIDQIREVQRLSTYSPYEGGARLFIFKDAERLTAQASNAFLKILEEPPKDHYFFLMSSLSYKLLPTLSSRLQKFQFQKLDEDVIEEMQKRLKLDVGSFGFMAEGSIKQLEACAKYAQTLQAFAQLIPFNYLSECYNYRVLLEALDQDDSFDMLEFLPLFEKLMHEYYYACSGLKSSSYPFVNQGAHKLQLTLLSQNLKQISMAYSSGMKISSCFERFFLNIH